MLVNPGKEVITAAKAATEKLCWQPHFHKIKEACNWKLDLLRKLAHAFYEVGTHTLIRLSKSVIQA